VFASLLLLFAQLADAAVYVTADVVNLRSEASAESERVTRIRINTELEVLEERGDWLHVSLTHRPQDEPITGWLLGRFVDSDPISVEYAHFIASLAAVQGDYDNAIRWAEREVAIDVTARDAWEYLAWLYASLGDEVGFERAMGTLEGTHDIWFGMCRNRRVSLEARYRPGLGISSSRPPYRPKQHHRHPFWVQQRLARDVQGLAWIEHADEVRAVKGTPFAHPFASATYNEPSPSPWRSIRCSEVSHEQMASCEEEMNAIVRLGPCEHHDAVYSTAALVPLDEPPPQWKEHHVDVPYSEEQTTWGHLEWRLTRRDTGRELVRLRRSTPHGYAVEFEAGYHKWGQWYRLNVIDGPRWLVVVPIGAKERSYGGHYWVVLDQAGNAEVVSTTTDSGGC